MMENYKGGFSLAGRGGVTRCSVGELRSQEVKVGQEQITMVECPPLRQEPAVFTSFGILHLLQAIWMSTGRHGLRGLTVPICSPGHLLCPGHLLHPNSSGSPTLT